MRSQGEYEAVEERLGRFRFKRQLARYHEALETILSVPEMSSVDVLENADFAFDCPELELRDSELIAQRALLVGQTLREYERVFSQVDKPPLTEAQFEWLARAAEVFSRRFEVLAQPSLLHPQDSPAAARATLQRLMTQESGENTARLVASAVGLTENTLRRGVFATQLRSKDEYVRAVVWTAFAESWPAIFDASLLGRRKLVLADAGRRQFLEQEIPRWLSQKDPQWFAPERILAAIKMLQEAVKYFSENGFSAPEDELTNLIREVQQILLNAFYRQKPRKDFRPRLETAYFQLEGLIPQVR